MYNIKCKRLVELEKKNIIFNILERNYKIYIMKLKKKWMFINLWGLY